MPFDQVSITALDSPFGVMDIAISDLAAPVGLHDTGKV
jgi:hypothetical protein